jgi:segregation and condensation protein A
MTITLASEAISSLIEMAESGEIDPWDVQVIEVIDRFLARAGLNDDIDLALARESLPRSGQAFLWASMLVLFKADTLERFSAPAEEEIPVADELLDLDEELRSLPKYLENHIRRRTAAPPPRQRRVTLGELIAQLQEIAAEIEAMPSVPVVTAKPRPRSRRETRQMIAELAHQENLTELAEELDRFLADTLIRFPSERIDFETLLRLWHEEKLPGETAGKEKVALFWALLLLASQSKVELIQTDFYQDLSIARLDPTG